MSQRLSGFFERRFDINPKQTVRMVHGLGIVGAALFFAVVSTLVIAFNDVFADQSIAGLHVGDIPDQNIFAPIRLVYVSDVLTEQAKIDARAAVEDVYDPPDGAIARSQTQLARQILDFINNIRRDVYGIREQKLDDLSKIAALTLDEGVVLNLLELDEETWRSIDEQITAVLERSQQQPIRVTDLSTVISRLPTQVSVRFTDRETAIITSIVEDLIRPNTFINPDQTEIERQAAADNRDEVTRSFEVGQTVARAGEPLTPATFEALQKLGLLEVSGQARRLQRTLALSQAFLVSVTSIIVVGLFVARFSSDLFSQPRFMLLGAGIYLAVLVGARFVGSGIGAYIYPTAALALLLVAIMGREVAIVSTISMAIMIGFAFGQSLEWAVYILVGGLIGTLTLQRAERLNSYFFAGIMVSIANIVVIGIFNLGISLIDTPLLVLFGLLNGVLVAAVAMVGMYIVSQLFNLPTGLRLVELGQANQPLLQRLLREAPGTYQHSLQVANLAEQATNAIGGSAELVRVAALYHDVGKMLNAPFFVENQADGVNPHDELADAYRSADIIISHVIEGDKLAKSYRIPAKIREFITEHHGTTRVEYFYRKAISQAGEEADIDSSDFSYPGPIPQSRETAIMMLADGCESTVRARRPSSKQELYDIVQYIIDSRIEAGQLDASNLTYNEIKIIRSEFVEILQAVFHPRINYPSNLSPQKTASKSMSGTLSPTPKTDSEPRKMTRELTAVQKLPATGKLPTTGKLSPPLMTDDEDDTPLPVVPPLPRKKDIAADEDTTE